jgi:hypothetical protein
MSDDTFFQDALRVLDRPIAPRAEFVDTLLATVLADAGLAKAPRTGARSHALRLGPVDVRLPISAWRVAVVILIILALVSVTIAVGAVLLRMRQGLVETPVKVTQIAVPAEWNLETLASKGDVGAEPALAYGPTGVPVIGYQDNTVDRVMIARCVDQACSSLGPAVDAGAVIPNLAAAGGYLAVGPTGEVWVARTAPGASAGDESHVEIERLCPEPAGTCQPLTAVNLGPGSRPLIRVRPDGRPVVVYWSPSDGASHLTVCGDAECGAGNVTTTVPVSAVDRDIGLTSGGLPVFVTSQDQALLLIECMDETCTRTSSVSIDSARQPRLRLDSHGRPLIAALADRSVVLYRCSDASCTSGERSSLAELGPPSTEGDEVVTLDLGADRDDRPFVSLSAGGSLQLLSCSTSACPEAVRIDLDTTSPAGAAPQVLGLDADGLPYVIYGVRSDLKAARCLDPGCLTPRTETAASPAPASASAPAASSSAQPTATSSESATAPASPTVGPTAVPQATTLYGLTRTQIDPAGGNNPAVTIGADGFPIAVYANGNGDALAVLHCADSRCGTQSTVNTIPYPDTWAGAITIDRSGLPVGIAADSGGTISLFRCADAGCRDFSIAGSLEGAITDFAAIAVVVPEDDRPLVAYQENENGQLRLARCSDPACGRFAQATFDPNPGGWMANSIELRLGTDGLPIFGYALANGEERIARCGDLKCTSATVTTIGTMAGELTTAALAVGPDGIAVLAYYSDGSLLLARCRDEACASAATVRVDQATAGWWTPIAIGFEERGFPVIVYWSPTNRDQKLALCHDLGCTSADLITIEQADSSGADDQTGLTFLPDNSPVYVYVRGTVVYTEICTDPRCGR